MKPNHPRNQIILPSFQSKCELQVITSIINDITTNTYNALINYNYDNNENNNKL